MQVPSKSPIVMGGRGARFLDLVKQNKLNVSPQLNNKRRFSMCDAYSRNVENFKPKQVASEAKSYLKFSSQSKFDPAASPSSSILSKRKAESQTPDSSPLASSSKVNNRQLSNKAKPFKALLSA